MDRTSKRLAIALALSLGLNLFVAGFVVARRTMLHRGLPPHGPMFGPHGFLGRVGLGDAGPQVERALLAQRDTLRAEREALQAARAEVRAALSQDPLDRARLQHALEGLRARTAEMQGTMHAALLDVASSLDASQRKRLANVPWLLRSIADR